MQRSPVDGACSHGHLHFPQPPSRCQTVCTAELDPATRFIVPLTEREEVTMTLPGPSRTITVEPIELPDAEPQPAPERELDPAPEPAEAPAPAPEREPEKVPG